ncbi:hypothetical protein Hamer_G026986 [Homarus americanus]|uniref:Uncharacterized protein n=1 Tax=Homarus americanus TaxID=6706 RepID=A0A8J5NC99_HOMAM|nr:hypothetical protein Hamer_G026986 [Homarus americanus]
MFGVDGSLVPLFGCIDPNGVHHDLGHTWPAGPCTLWTCTRHGIVKKPRREDCPLLAQDRTELVKWQKGTVVMFGTVWVVLMQMVYSGRLGKNGMIR